MGDADSRAPNSFGLLKRHFDRNVILSPSTVRPELRRDPITGRSVIIAIARSERPNALPTAAIEAMPEDSCPFCPGNESKTPSAVSHYVSGTQESAQSGSHEPPSWTLRVIPNLYPATAPCGKAPCGKAPSEKNSCGKTGDEAKTSEEGDPISGSSRPDWFISQPNVGRHEVVVESNRHLTSFTELTPSEAEDVFLAYASRFRAWQRESPNVRYAIAFKNNGRQAGASIEHIHSQLIGLEHLPSSFLEEWNQANCFYEKQNVCVFCEATKREVADGVRVVDSDNHFVVVCPYASRMPYEMQILPRSHASHFDQEADTLVRAAGRKTHEMLTRLSKLIENVPYNFLIHSAPFDTQSTPVYHWHIEVIPRIASLAGFEWGTGCHLNPVSPEQAASRLRAV